MRVIAICWWLSLENKPCLQSSLQSSWFSCRPRWYGCFTNDQALMQLPLPFSSLLFCVKELAFGSRLDQLIYILYLWHTQTSLNLGIEQYPRTPWNTNLRSNINGGWLTIYYVVLMIPDYIEMFILNFSCITYPIWEKHLRLLLLECYILLLHTKKDILFKCL